MYLRGAKTNSERRRCFSSRNSLKLWTPWTRSAENSELEGGRSTSESNNELWSDGEISLVCTTAYASGTFVVNSPQNSAKGEVMFLRNVTSGFSLVWFLKTLDRFRIVRNGAGFG